METFFETTTRDLTLLKDSFRLVKTADSERILERMHTYSLQLGFVALSDQIGDLSATIRNQSATSIISQSLLFFLKCELQIIQIEWKFIVCSKPPEDPSLKSSS
jgi:hypothetical protein